MNMERLEQIPTGTIAGVKRPVSRLFFGTTNPPIATDDGAAAALLDSVLACGVNAFDCARSYGNAEIALGKWMESRGCRNDVTVLSKCGDIRSGRVEVNPRVIDEQLQQSLEALRTDHIDIFLLHRDDPNTPVEAFIDALNEQKEMGRIGVFGVSNWNHRRLDAANRYALAHGLTGFGASSPNYGLARQVQDLWGGGCVTISGPENDEAVRWYTENQMPVIAYSSLGRGFFSGRFRAFDYETARSVLDSYAQKGYLCDENMERLRRAEMLAERYSVSVPEIAMRYIFGSPMNIFAVVSTTNADRMSMNLRASANPLSSEDRRFLEA